MCSTCICIFCLFYVQCVGQRCLLHCIPVDDAAWRVPCCVNPFCNWYSGTLQLSTDSCNSKVILGDAAAEFAAFQ